MQERDLPPGVLKVCSKIAHKVSRMYGFEFEETMDDALLWAVEAMYTYDPSQGAALTSWVYRVVYFELTERAPRKFRNAAVDIDLVPADYDSSTDPERVSAFRESLRSLSQEAKKLAAILFSAPGEVVSVIAQPRKMRQALVDHAVNNYGMGRSECSRALEELQRIAF